MSSADDTIYALSTPSGVSGVAVIRVSGPQAQGGLELLTGRGDYIPGQAVLRRLKEPVSRETIDQAIVLSFEAPKSFTGEDCVEYHIHGSIAVVHAMLDALGRCAGHRMAEPGEFTRRAFDNGKMDLAEAEAVADLIHAETELQRRQAVRQMGGALSEIYESWRMEIAKILAYLEAHLDFPDEDLPDDILAPMRPQLERLQAAITDHLQDNRRGERLRHGVTIAVIGAPNAGKSSLVNLLAQRDVAIVSQHAGTTRDVLEVHLDIGGYPVIVADTAGLRPEAIDDADAQHQIEAEGMRRALQWAQNADLKLLLFNAEDIKSGDWDHNTLSLWGPHSMAAVNKSEILSESEQSHVTGQWTEHSGGDAAELTLFSVETGQGMDILLNGIKSKVADLLGKDKGEAPPLTRQRHRQALEAAFEATQRAMRPEITDQPELIAEDLRLAARYIGRITGRVDVEDLLDIIFRDFCIGK